MDVLRFAMLGLGSGAVYGLMALGVVVVYRSSAVLNFAHGAIGMMGAYAFYLSRPTIGLIPAALFALTVGATLGGSAYLVVMRRLRRAPALTSLIATLAMLSVLEAFGALWWGEQPRIIDKLLPVDAVTLWSDVTVGVDRFIVLAVGAVLTVVLSIAYRRTTFGLATTAVAERPEASAAQGISPDSIAAVNWTVSGVLAVIGAVLIVNMSGLQVRNLTLLIVPVLAAALIGDFRSFVLTFVGGVAIGVLESEVSYLQVRFPDVRFDGWSRTVPFLVIIAVLMLRGRSLPARGESAERPPMIGTGLLNGRPFIAVMVIATALISMASNSWVDALTTACGMGLVCLSLVVVTGYAGQLSIAQMALAGFGAWVAAKLVADYGLGFGPAALVAVIASIPAGIAVGLPAARTRGLNLAVATLGLALLLENQIFGHPERGGGLLGIDVGSPTLFGIDIDGVRHPRRYAVVAVAVFMAGLAFVALIRRSSMGRGMIAVRSNERAAASVGINVVAVKVVAFAASAALAAAGGVLLAFRRPTVTFLPAYEIFQSIEIVMTAVLGGVGFIAGSVIGGVNAKGGLVYQMIRTWFGDGISEVFRIGGGLFVLNLVLREPNGFAALGIKSLRRLLRSPHRPVPAIYLDSPADSGASGGRADSSVARSELVVEGVSVRFGGVVAVDGVSFRVGSGEVLGIIGPNGAGKTTLIDAITGFVNASGSVRLNGRELSELSASRRAEAGLSRSFQSIELFESMTIGENIETAFDRRGPVATIKDMVRRRRRPLSGTAAAAVVDLGLADELARRPEELAYGQRRLAAIARSIAAGATVLMLDEPAAGLDANDRVELRAIVRRLAEDWNLAIILVEHDVPLVLDVSDRILVLASGAPIAAGLPNEVASDPRVIESYLGASSDADGPPIARPTKTSGTALVRARGLVTGYRGVPVGRGLALDVGAGEIVALLGPNGAGKSTTLRTLAGLLDPIDGELEVLGSTDRVGLHRLARRGLAYVPEERSVFMSMSAADNLRLGLGATDDALNLFPELRSLLNRRTGLLSGGEQQILTLARALASQPKLLLADELSLGLAPLIVERLLSAIRAAADEGLGVLLVEQHARQALMVADRAYVLRGGEIVMEGRAADLAANLDEVERAYLSGVAEGEEPAEEPVSSPMLSNFSVTN